MLKLAWKNLSVIASVMLLSNHLKMELKCLGEHACLLAVNTSQFIPSGAFPNCEGAYLYFNGNRGAFVRSGKVVRQGLKEQGEEHLTCAKEEKSSSHFYFLYPSMNGKRRDKRDKLGCFEHLTQVIAAGFDPSSKPAKIFGQGSHIRWVTNHECRRSTLYQVFVEERLNFCSKTSGNNCLPI